MSAPPPPYAPYPPPRRRGPSTTTIVLIVVGALVAGMAALGIVGFVTYRLVRDNGQGDGATSGPVERAPAPTATAPLPSTEADLDTFYSQKLRWRDCGDAECTKLRVPLDYAQPAGQTISIAVIRVPAADRAKRIGQLVVNPGGPGVSGFDYAEGGERTFGPALARVYDIVGFDPRGVSRSAPIECLDTRQTDEYLSSDPDPDDATETEEFGNELKTFGQGCVRRSGALASHISTVEAAKDMDVLRAALGEPKLDYLGASYGTYLGATYADLFPTHVGRMVLDGALDPTLSTEQQALVQVQGFQTALDAYINDCVRRGRCPLGDSTEQANARLTKFLRDLDAKPLPTGTDRKLTEGLGVYGIFLPLYVKSFWPTLTSALRLAFAGDGRALLSIADQYNSRGGSGYDDNSVQALLAVNCLDHGDAVPLADVPSKIAEFEKASPVFGRAFAYSLAGCDDWPAGQGAQPKALRAAGAPPIVVVGTTRDPATPYVMAKALAAQLESGHLITRDGDGHTGFRMGNDCVDSAVENFLLQDRVPRDGLTC